ncbi:hypothetical protein HDU83_003103 [Entophlyctis luteolus]|nr:hypothetical protein HDU83_003103 [Entophlyctis luteolus]
MASTRWPDFMSTYQLQEWSATYILFILWCIALFVAPFMSLTHPRDVLRSAEAAYSSSTTSGAAPAIAAARGSETTYNRAVQLAKNARLAFLLVFASTVAHNLVSDNGHAPSHATAGITWATLAFELVWLLVVAAGHANSVIYDAGALAVVLALQIVNFGLAFPG